MQTDRRKARVESQFLELYGESPLVWVQAPGRVDLMGSHTDYNQGYVLTQAIDRQTWIAARPRQDERVRIGSLNLPGRGEFDLGDIQLDQEVFWTNYIRGVAQVMQQDGYRLRGFDGLVHSEVPVGSGLSSSAALEISGAILFAHLNELDISPVEIARMCQRAENEFVGMNCGILDQYTATMGEAGCVLLLDCREISSQTYRVAPGVQVVICDTRSKRQLAKSEYSLRRAQCEHGVRLLSEYYPAIRALRDLSPQQFERYVGELPQEIAKRCSFIIEENHRVLEIAQAISVGDRERISALTQASFTGARDGYEITSPEMERMMAAMLSAPGAIGARQAGAGFGGCMVAFVEFRQVEAFCEHVGSHYQASSGIEAKIYPVQAAGGGGLLVW
jgi:galactokinase